MFEIIGTNYSASFRTETNGFFVRVWAAAARHDPHHGGSECCRLRRRGRCVHRRPRPGFPSTAFEVTSSKLPSSSSPGTCGSDKGRMDAGCGGKGRCVHRRPRPDVPSSAVGVASSSSSSPGTGGGGKGGSDAGCGGKGRCVPASPRRRPEWRRRRRHPPPPAVTAKVGRMPAAAAKAAASIGNRVPASPRRRSEWRHRPPPANLAAKAGRRPPLPPHLGPRRFC